MNCRRFPRTSSGADAAFRDATYATAIEPPPPKRRISEIAFGIALAVVVALTVFVLIAYPGAPT